MDGLEDTDSTAPVLNDSAKKKKPGLLARLCIVVVCS